MNSSIRKLASTRKMRVATLFTGAAACAVGFAPTAAAAATGIHLPELHTGGTPTSIPHCTGHSTWMHMAFEGPETESACFGYTGYDYNVASHNTTYAFQICGGNNVGTYYGVNRHTNQYTDAGYREGTTWVSLPGNSTWDVSTVYNSGWSHSDKCG